jgi:hypothetical protein
MRELIVESRFEKRCLSLEVRMRKALLVLGICILAVPAWAGGGFSLFGSYAQLSDDSEALGAGGRFTFGGQNWVGDLSWTWYPSKSDVDTIAGRTDKLQVIPTDLGVRYLFNTSGSFRPYVGGGGTFFYNNLNDGNIDNAFGFYGLLGFNFGNHTTKFFLEGIYRFGEADVTYAHPSNPTRGKMDVGGFGVNAGVIWTY